MSSGSHLKTVSARPTTLRTSSSSSSSCSTSSSLASTTFSEESVHAELNQVLQDRLSFPLKDPFNDPVYSADSKYFFFDPNVPEKQEMMYMLSNEMSVLLRRIQMGENSGDGLVLSQLLYRYRLKKNGVQLRPVSEWDGNNFIDFYGPRKNPKLTGTDAWEAHAQRGQSPRGWPGWRDQN